MFCICCCDCLQNCWRPPVVQARTEAQVMRTLEALLAAGYRPTVWHKVQLPRYLHRGSAVVGTFDPFDHHSCHLSTR